MKNTLFVLFFITLSSLSLAQQQGDHVIGAQLGFSATGAIFRAATSGDLTSDSASFSLNEASSTPAFSVTYDYHITDGFSIGGVTSMQFFNLNLDEIDVNVGGRDTVLRQIDGRFNRVYLGIVPRYHFTTEDENLDLYSAARIGYILWRTNLSSDDLSNVDAISSFVGGRPSVALVPIGGRYYFTPEFAFNFELAIGAPYLFNLGLNYKL